MVMEIGLSSHVSIYTVRHLCLASQPGAQSVDQFIPKISPFRDMQELFLPLQLWQIKSLWTSVTAETC